MAGALAPAADTRVALKAVASIDRLITESPGDLFLKEILISAAFVLRDTPEQSVDLRSAQFGKKPKYLH